MKAFRGTIVQGGFLDAAQPAPPFAGGLGGSFKTFQSDAMPFFIV
jgi:hypothetical protein